MSIWEYEDILLLEILWHIVNYIKYGYYQPVVAVRGTGCDKCNVASFGQKLHFTKNNWYNQT